MLHELFPTIPTTTAAALAVFDAAEAVEPEFMIGTWHGAELPTQHPMDGLLEASGHAAQVLRPPLQAVVGGPG